MKNSNATSKNASEIKVNLFRVAVADQLPIYRDGGWLVANWDTVKWNECIKIGKGLVGPVAAVLGIEQNIVRYEEEIQEVGGDYGLASVVFIADIGQALVEPKKQKLDEAISSFLGYVYRENGRNLDLFDNNLDDVDFDMVVREHASFFLKENGGGKISTPIHVSSTTFNKTCTGSFSRKPVVPPGKKVEQIFVGKVISMFCEKTEFVLKSESKDPVTIAYSKNIFFHELKGMLGEPIRGAFYAHESFDPQGRIFLVLDSISDKYEDSGTLL